MVDEGCIYFRSFSLTLTEISFFAVTSGLVFCGVTVSSSSGAGAGGAEAVFTVSSGAGTRAGGAGAGYFIPGGVLLNVLPLLNGDGHSSDLSLLIIGLVADILSRPATSVTQRFRRIVRFG